MSPPNKSQKTSQENKVEYPCDFCDKMYTVKASYNSHIRNKHKDEISSNKENKKPDSTFDSEIDAEAEIMIMAVEEEVARELGEGANEIEERLGIQVPNLHVEENEIQETAIVKVVNIAPEVPLGQGPANFYVSNPKHPLTCSQRIEITDDIQEMLDGVINDQNFSNEKEPDEIAKEKLSQMYNCFISQTSETDINQSEQNTTCGECGKTFQTEDEGHKHMDTVHSCQECKVKHILVDKKDQIIDKILLKIKMLTKDKRTMNLKIKALYVELDKSNKLVAKYKKEAATLSFEKDTLIEKRKLDEKKNEEGLIEEKKAEEKKNEEKKVVDETRQNKIDETYKYAPPDPNKIGKCKTCGYKANLEGLKTHRLEVHPESLKYKCPLCDKMFALKKVLRVHQHMHRRLGYVCNICKKKLPNRNAFQQHRQKKCKTVGLHPNLPNLAQHKPSEGGNDVGQSPLIILERELSCQMCEFKTNNQSNMIDHIKGKHNPKPKYQCDTCGTRFNKNEELVCHTLEEHTNISKTPIEVQARPQVQRPDIELHCPKCDFKSNKQSKLVKHIKHAHDPKPKHQCDTCEKTFERTNDLVNHLIKEHVSVNTRDRQTVLDEGMTAGNVNRTRISTENWNCHFCGSKDMTTKQRDNHICRNHPYKTTQQQKKQIKRKSVECIWGTWCTWYEIGKCWYKHDSNSLTWTEEGREQESRISQTFNNKTLHEQATGGRIYSSKWCAYQDKCDRREICTFKHFEDITCDNEEEDFMVEMVKRKAQELTTSQWKDF